MPLERLTDWVYPAQIEDIKDVEKYLRTHYQQHVDESANRITDFEMNILTVDTWNFVGDTTGATKWHKYKGLELTSVGYSNHSSMSQAALWANYALVHPINITTGENMGGSHTHVYSSDILVDVSAGDGGGTPTNPLYQEVSTFESSVTLNAPGHYTEGIGMYVVDNGNANRWNNFLAVLIKKAANNVYEQWGFMADSSASTQLTTNAPSGAFKANGPFQRGLDLSSGTYNDTDIQLPQSIKIFTTGTPSKLLINISNNSSLTISVAGVSIGTITPAAKLDVRGGLLINTDAGITTTGNGVSFGTDTTPVIIGSILPYNAAGKYGLQFNVYSSGLATKMTISGDGVVTAGSTIDAIGGFKDNGVAGIDTTFLDAGGNTITISGGICTAKTAP